MSLVHQARNVANRLLSNGVVRRTYRTINRGMLTLGGGSRLGATIYSFFGFLIHNREQYAVLSGRRAYFQNLSKHRTSHVELRRNIHRIEKGLAMQPRRASFGAEYIAETMEFYLHAVSSANDGALSSEELTWAHDVLAEYFDVVDESNRAVKEAKERFALLPVVESCGYKPYRASERPALAVSYDNLVSLAQRRRSVRWFDSRPVERELIDKALDVARMAPTACNRLPYEFLVFDSPEDVATVGAVPAGASGYYHQIPTLIVVKGDLSAYFSARDRHAIYVDASLAAMSFLFAAETLGLGASVINWPDFEPLEAKLQRVLGLKPYERIVMLMAVGYADADGVIPFSQKKHLDVLRRFATLD